MRATRPSDGHLAGLGTHHGYRSSIRRAGELLHRRIHLPAALQTPVTMLHLGAAIASTAAVAGGLTVGARVGISTHEPAPDEVESALLESSSCDDAGAATALNGGNVTVMVPPTALVHVDERGRVVAALTNTGCAPRPTDEVYVVLPTGATERTESGLADRPWHGDFRVRGRLVQQPGHD